MDLLLMFHICGDHTGYLSGFYFYDRTVHANTYNLIWR